MCSLFASQNPKCSDWRSDEDDSVPLIFVFVITLQLLLHGFLKFRSVFEEHHVFRGPGIRGFFFLYSITWRKAATVDAKSM